MPEILTGYGAFHWVETWSHPALDVFFRAVTDLGYPLVYYLLIAPLFWVVDRRRALVLFLLLLLSALLNAEAKLLFDTPRPDPALARVLDLRPLQSGSRSFPSGHAQIAVVFWGYLAYWVARPWLTALAAFLIAAISFSRIYLGAHFPIDVAAGLLAGGLTLAAIPALERWAGRGFPLPSAARAGFLVLAAGAMALVADPGLAVVFGSLVALIGVLSLPAAELTLTPRAAVVAVVCGLLLQMVCSGLLERVSPGQPLFVRGLGVAVLWLIALWVYPHAVALLLARRQTAPAD